MIYNQDHLVDPDPFIIVNTALAAAAVVLQFVQVWRGAGEAPASLGDFAARDKRLEKLESALEEFDAVLERAEKKIRRHSSESDKEIYEVKFGISLGILNFEARHVSEYHDDCAKLMSKLSQLTIWVGSIIASDPDAARHLGRHVEQQFGDAADVMNRLISEQAPNSAILYEAKRVRAALRKALAERHAQDNY